MTAKFCMSCGWPGGQAGPSWTSRSSGGGGRVEHGLPAGALPSGTGRRAPARPVAGRAVLVRGDTGRPDRHRRCARAARAAAARAVRRRGLRPAAGVAAVLLMLAFGLAQWRDELRRGYYTGAQAAAPTKIWHQVVVYPVMGD